MSARSERLAELIPERLEGLIDACHHRYGQVTVEIAPEHLIEACRKLRDDPDLAFEQLIDLCGIDYQTYGMADWETSDMVSGAGFSRGVEGSVYVAGDEARPRFQVAYQLLSVSRNWRLRLRCAARGEPPRVESVAPLWNGANWFEREAFDLMGILFEGHPDLRRILTDYGFVGHPFRKDFPVTGEVEMRYDPAKGRVVYEPVSITPRTLVPRVIRNDARYQAEVPEPAGSGDGAEGADHA